MKTIRSLAAIHSAKEFLGITLFVLALGITSQAATYYSQGSVDPVVLSNWNDVPAGGGASPADFVTPGDIFVVQTNHNMTNSAPLNVIGTIQIQSNAMLVAAGGRISAGTGQIDNGGTFIVAYANGNNGSALDILGTNKVYGASSTVEIQQWGNGTGTSLAPFQAGIAWGNIVINITNNLAAAWQQAGAVTNILGDLVMKSMGTSTNQRDFRLNANSPATLTVNIGGNVRVSGGILNFVSGTSIATINIGGTIEVTGGMVQSSGTGVPIITVTANSGKITVSGGGTNLLSGNYANPPGSPVADAITLDNGSFGVIGADFTLTANRGITVTANGGSLVQASTRTLTIPGNITGPGSVTKTYISGTTVNLTLSGTNDFEGDFITTGGGTRFNSDFAAGKGRVIVSPLLGGTASVTLRNLGVAISTLTNDVVFNTNNGLVITLDSDVTGTFVMSGRFSGVGTVVHGTNTGGTVVLSGDNAAWSGGLTARRGTLRLSSTNALGTGTYIIAPVTTAGQMAVSLQAGIPLAGASAITNAVNFNILTNNGTAQYTISGANDLEFAGPISLGASTNSPIVTNLNSGATIFSGPISGATGLSLTKVGTSTLTISNGANSYDGGTVINEGALKIINVSGSALGSGSVTVGANGTLTGNGSAAGAVALSGTISPGNSVGSLGSGSETWAGGGVYTFEINSSGGTAGTSPGWDKLNITGGLDITATSGNKFIINITSLTLANAPGAVSDFSETNNYSWVIASTTTGVTGFDTNAFTLNTNNFVNSIGGGAFSITTNGNDLVLRFTAASAALPPDSFVTTAAGQGTFAGSPNTTYTVEYVDDLDIPIVWQTLTNVVTDGSGIGAFNDTSAPGGQPQRYYRVKYP